MISKEAELQDREDQEQGPMQAQHPGLGTRFEWASAPAPTFDMKKA